MHRIRSGWPPVGGFVADLVALGPGEVAAAAAAILWRILCSGSAAAAVLAPASLWSHGASLGACQKKLEVRKGFGGLLEEPELAGFGDRRRPMFFQSLDPTPCWWILRLTKPVGKGSFCSSSSASRCCFSFSVVELVSAFFLSSG